MSLALISDTPFERKRLRSVEGTVPTVPKSTAAAVRRSPCLWMAFVAFFCVAACTGRAQEQRPFASPLAPSADTSAAAPSPSAAGTVAYTNSMAVLDDQRKLGNGDRVSFRVVEDRKLPVPLIVTDSGEMEVPLIGRVTARGKTCKQIAFEVKRLLEKDYFRSCTVIIGLDSVSSKSRGKIYVMGQVRNQGPQDIPADETFTVSRAILRAGGFADFANKKKVRLTRKLPNGGSETTAIDLVQVLDKGKTDKDVELQPDDLIVVPERLINF